MAPAIPHKTKPKYKSFRTAFVWLLVLSVTLTAVLMTGVLGRQIAQLTGDFGQRQSQLQADKITFRMAQELALVFSRSETIALDSDVQLGDRSILFYDRISSRFNSFIKANNLVSGIFLYSQSGQLIAAAPAALELVRLPKFEFGVASLQLLEVNEPKLIDNSKDNSTASAYKNSKALFLFLPIRNTFNDPEASLVVVVSLENLLRMTLPLPLVGASLGAQGA